MDKQRFLHCPNCGVETWQELIDIDYLHEQAHYRCETCKCGYHTLPVRFAEEKSA